MNLVLDLGNTYGKIAVCKGTDVIEAAIYERISSKEIAYFQTCYKDITGAIISSVVNHSREIIDYLCNMVETCIELNNNTPLPINNKYKTPDTLGYDRIAAVSGAHTIFPGTDVLVIDAGTAITYDLVTSNGDYLGGNIAPGKEMRFKALNKYTNKLPLLDADEGQIDLVGGSTTEAIQSGVINGILFEMEGFIASLRQEYPKLQVVITGGDAKFFEKKVKSSIFVNLNLNIIGLNRILEYNAGKNI